MKSQKKKEKLEKNSNIKIIRKRGATLEKQKNKKNQGNRKQKISAKNFICVSSRLNNSKLFKARKFLIGFPILILFFSNKYCPIH